MQVSEKGNTNSENIRLLADNLPSSKWCVWKAKVREGGKVAKIPHVLEGSRLVTVATTEHEKWGSFSDACEWLSKFGADGLGILIGSNPSDTVGFSSGLVAVDIDSCLDKETGDYIDGLDLDVKMCVEELLSAGIYVEISPSGTGIRAFYLGEKARGIREKRELAAVGRELYDSKSGGRYVTCTGVMFRGSKPELKSMDEDFSLSVAEWLGLLKEQNDSDGGGAGTPRNLVELTDADIVAKVKQSGQGKYKKLFEGDTGEYGGDHSACDIALALAIARYSDDATQVERVFSLSELAKRAKWKERRDYRESTVKKALKSARDSAENANDAKTARIKKALAEGDSSGLLAEAVKAWGGKVPNTLAGLQMVITLDKRLEGVLAFDEFTGRVLKLRSLHSCLGDVVAKDSEPWLGQGWSDVDTRALTVWLGTVWGVTANTGQVDEAVNESAMRFKVNTVVDKLEILKWDGKLRLRSMLVDYFNADDSLDSPLLLGEMGTRFMISAVRRAYAPGTKADAALVASGGQGYGKSNAIRTLTHAIAPHAFLEGLPALGQGQEAERALQGIWICELAELAFQDRVSTEHIKSFLTRCEDTYRSPYGRRTQAVKRTACFVGTTNQEQFVRDSTGARRFWCFTVSKQIDIEKLARDATQLWAEAVVLHKAGEPHWLTNLEAIREAEASQRRRLETNGWDELIEERLVEPMIEGKIVWREFYVQFKEIWDLVNPQNPDGMTAQCPAFSNALIRVGFTRTKPQGRSMWRVGAVLQKRLLETLRN